MTKAFSWQNSISLYPASFCTPRQNLPVSPGISLLPTFPLQSPIMKRTSFSGVVEGLIDLRRTIQLQFLLNVPITGWDINLYYCDTDSFPYSSVGKETACKAWDLVWFLCQKDPLEKEMAIHSSVLFWKIPWAEEPGWLQSMGLQSQTYLMTKPPPTPPWFWMVCLGNEQRLFCCFWDYI